ncbi:MAG: hypothetical protein MUE87_01620 [Methanothrix sp.]|jgi:hypothetical protein|nr:hypothetical protein [Methanothrix sp.]
MIKAWIASFFMILFLSNIPAVSMSARDNFAPLFASLEKTDLDLIIEEKTDPNCQDRGYASILESKARMKSAIDVETKIMESPSNSRILSNDIHLVVPGIATVTILSNKTGYDVYVDSSFSETEGSNEPMDGKIVIYVAGNTYHNISIAKERDNYYNNKSMNFETDRSYLLIL